MNTRLGIYCQRELLTGIVRKGDPGVIRRGTVASVGVMGTPMNDTVLVLVAYTGGSPPFAYTTSSGAWSVSFRSVWRALMAHCSVGLAGRTRCFVTPAKKKGKKGVLVVA